MTPIRQRFGVDVDQWKALTRVFVRADFGSSIGALGRGAAVRSNAGLAVAALFYGMTGLGVGLMALSSSDPWLRGTVIATYVAVFVSTNTLATHAGTIISPDDHAILGFRPVTSRTYLAVRVTTILVHTALTGALVGYAPVFVLAIGAGPAAGLATAATIAAAATAVTLTIVAGYAWLMNVAGPVRIGRMVSYAQLVSSSITYVGLALMSGSSVRHALDGAGLPRTGWILLYPGAWFGSYVAFAGRDWSQLVLAAIVLSLICLGGLLWALDGKLSLGYSERLSAIAASAAARSAAPKAGWQLPFFRRGEARAIAMLVRTQFKYDNRFRLGVLTFLPLTIFYLYLGARDQQITDPFLGAARSSSPVMLMQLMLYFMPATLKQQITASDAYRASWIFHAAPADRTRLVVAARNAITAYVVMPYLLLLFAFYAWAFGSVWHALLQVLFLGLMSQIVFEIIVLVDPRLPFSEPMNRGRQQGTMLALMAAVMVFGGVFYGLVAAVVYPRPPAVAATLALLAAAVWGLDWLTRVRIERTVADQTYLE